MFPALGPDWLFFLCIRRLGRSFFRNRFSAWTRYLFLFAQTLLACKEVRLASCQVYYFCRSDLPFFCLVVLLSFTTWLGISRLLAGRTESAARCLFTQGGSRVFFFFRPKVMTPPSSLTSWIGPIALRKTLGRLLSSVVFPFGAVGLTFYVSGVSPCWHSSRVCLSPFPRRIFACPLSPFAISFCPITVPLPRKRVPCPVPKPSASGQCLPISLPKSVSLLPKLTY